MKKIVRVVGGVHQRRLLYHLFEENKYDPLERPVQNDSHTLPVAMNLAIQQIIDFVSIFDTEIHLICLFKQDEKNEIISISGWLVLVSISVVFSRY
jgi:hypothetical protein